MRSERAPSLTPYRRADPLFYSIHPVVIRLLRVLVSFVMSRVSGARLAQSAKAFVVTHQPRYDDNPPLGDIGFSLSHYDVLVSRI